MDHATTTPKRTRKLRRLLPAVLAIGMFAAACGSDDDEGSADAGTEGTTADGSTETTAASGGEASGEPFHVGVMGPLSGNLGSIGTNFLTGIEAVVDAANAEGGVHGRPIEITAQDDANDPATGIAAARSLTGEGVIAVLGPPVSSIIEAVAPTTSRASVPMLTFGATPALLDPVQETIFQVDETSASMAQPMVDFAAALLGKDDFRTSIAPIDTPSGLAWGELVAELEGQGSFEILSTTPIPVAGGDITPQAQSIVQGDPEIVLVEVTDGTLVTLVQKLRDLGFEGPIVNFHAGSTTNAIRQINDPDVYVARTSEQYAPGSESPGTQRFVEITDAAGQVEAAESASQYTIGYLVGITLIAALEECGADCDSAGLTEALSDFELDTEGFTAEPIQFGADDHQGIEHVRFYSWDGTEAVVALDGEVFAGSVYSLEAE